MIHLAENLDTLSRAEIDRLRADNLAATLAAARQSTSVGSCGSDLAKLPMLSPGELAVSAPPRSQRYVFAGDRTGLVLRSSGTAAIAKVLYHSWPFTRRVELLGARGLRAALPE